jgi:hypothetical protein
MMRIIMPSLESYQIQFSTYDGNQGPSSTFRNLLLYEIQPKMFLTVYEACPKSIQLYFFPEKPVTAGWQI